MLRTSNWPAAARPFKLPHYYTQRRQRWKEKTKQDRHEREATCYLVELEAMKSSAVVLLLYHKSALEGSVVILHSKHAAFFFFFLGIEKVCYVRSVTSCGSIYVSLTPMHNLVFT